LILLDKFSRLGFVPIIVTKKILRYTMLQLHNVRSYCESMLDEWLGVMIELGELNQVRALS